MSESLDNDDKINATLFAAAFEELDGLRKELAQIPLDIEKSASNFERVTTQNVDNFVDVANEALSKMMQKTKALIAAVEALDSTPLTKKEVIKEIEPSSSQQTWLNPAYLFSAFLIGTIFGVCLTLVVQK